MDRVFSPQGPPPVVRPPAAPVVKLSPLAIAAAASGGGLGPAPEPATLPARTGPRRRAAEANQATAEPGTLPTHTLSGARLPNGVSLWCECLPNIQYLPNMVLPNLLYLPYMASGLERRTQVDRSARDVSGRRRTS